MPGDSETKTGDQAENESGNREPFLIGVAGGTASGKVGINITLQDFWYLLFKHSLYEKICVNQHRWIDIICCKGNLKKKWGENGMRFIFSWK